MLTRCLQSSDERVAMLAARAILDRGYGKPVQSIDANITENEPIRFAEVPMKSSSSEQWLADIGRPMIVGVAGVTAPRWRRATGDGLYLVNPLASKVEFNPCSSPSMDEVSATSVVSWPRAHSRSDPLHAAPSCFDCI